VFGGKIQVGPHEGAQPCLQVALAIQLRLLYQGFQMTEPARRQGAQQVMLVPEMVIGRGAGHPHLLGQLAQGQSLDAALAEQLAGALQQGGAQVTVVVIVVFGHERFGHRVNLTVSRYRPILTLSRYLVPAPPACCPRQPLMML
jgi:hypothetical protein